MDGENVVFVGDSERNGPPLDSAAINDPRSWQGDSPFMDPAARQADPFSGAFWSPLFTEDPTTARIGTYRSVLSEAEARQIEAACADFDRVIRYW